MESEDIVRARRALPEKDEPILPYNPETAISLTGTYTIKYRNCYAENSIRTISIRELYQRDGELLIVSYCHLRQKERTFYVSRIEKMFDENDREIDTPFDLFYSYYFDRRSTNSATIRS